jgi:hypothetical protein
MKKLLIIKQKMFLIFFLVSCVPAAGPTHLWRRTGLVSDRRRRSNSIRLVTTRLNMGTMERDWLHFSSVDVAPRKRTCTFFLQDLSKRKYCLYRSSRFFSRKTDEILMYDGISVDKILAPKQVGYFGTRILNWKQSSKIENSLAAPRRGLVKRIPH